jgi:hypothetical protein
MKTLRSYSSIILGLLKSNISLKLEYFIDSSAKSGALLSNTSKFLELENYQVYEIGFSANETHYYGLSFNYQSDDETKIILEGLGLSSTYHWITRKKDTCVVVIKCQDLEEALKNPVTQTNLSIHIHPKAELPAMDIVHVTRIILEEDVLTGQFVDPPAEIDIVRFNRFLKDYYNCDGLLRPLEEIEVINIDTESLPILSESTLSKMPAIVQEFLALYNSKKAKSLAAYSLLVGLSGCMPNLVGSHFSKRMWANLFMIVVAAAGRGKNVVDDVHAILYKIETWWRDEFKELVSQYKSDLKKFKSGEISEEPEKPTLRSLFVSLDASSAAFFQRLVGNQGVALCIDTEIDSFVNNNSKDWGGFSVFLRKAFHFEVIDLDRASFESAQVIEKPKITMIMAGTFGQFQKLFPNTEDGLYSRCIVITIPHTKLELENPYINSNSDFFFEGSLDSIGGKVLEQYHTLLNRTEILFQWTNDQAEKLMHFFRQNVDPFAAIHSEESDAIILRHMNMVTRFAMIISALRAHERGELQTITKLSATNDDLEIVMELMGVSLQHNMAILTMLKQSKGQKRDVKNMTKNAFLQSLPLNSTVSRRESLAIGKANRVPERSVDKYLADLSRDGFLKQIKIGVYKRIK